MINWLNLVDRLRTDIDITKLKPTDIKPIYDEILKLEPEIKNSIERELRNISIIAEKRCMQMLFKALKNNGFVFPVKTDVYLDKKMAEVDMTLLRGTDATSQPYKANSNQKQVGCLMTEINYELLEKLFSKERVNTYLRLADGNKQKATDLYLEDLRQSQIFYAKLHWLEIGLRNAVNRQLSQKYGSELYNNPNIGLN